MHNQNPRRYQLHTYPFYSKCYLVRIVYTILVNIYFFFILTEVTLLLLFYFFFFHPSTLITNLQYKVYKTFTQHKIWQQVMHQKQANYNHKIYNKENANWIAGQEINFTAAF